LSFPGQASPSSQVAPPTARASVRERARSLGSSVLALHVAGYAAAAVFVATLCRRSINLADEGYLVSQALEMLNGKVLYRDLDLFVTPGLWYLNALTFAVAGPSVLATRVVAGLCLLATFAVVQRIVAEIGGWRWGAFAAVMLAILTVWAFPAWTVSFYSQYAALFALCAFACLQVWSNTRSGRWMLACGVLVGLAVVFKQNYGVFAAAGCALAVVVEILGTSRGRAPAALRSDIKRALVLAVAGGAVIGIAVTAHIVASGAAAEAFDSLVLRPFQGFAEAHSIPYPPFADLWERAVIRRAGGLTYLPYALHNTPSLLQWPGILVAWVESISVLLYWIPPMALAAGAVVAARRRRSMSAAERKTVTLTVFVAMFFLGVFPRADFNHLINVMQPAVALSVSLAALALGNDRWRSSRWRMAAAAVGAVVVLSYAGIGAQWYYELYRGLAAPLAAPRAGVLIDSISAGLLDYEIETLRSMTAEDEPVLALPGLSMIPFLAERPMHTRYYNYYSVHIGHDEGAGVVAETEHARVNVVLADYNNFFSDPVGLMHYAPVLTDYIRRNFEPVMSLGNHARALLKKREHPLPDTPWIALWFFCETRSQRWPLRHLREHLLFHALYHSYGDVDPEDRRAGTLCDFRVREDTVLSVSLDVSQPGPAAPDAVVVAELWLIPEGGEPRILHEMTRSLATEATWSAPPAVPLRFDLSAHAGRGVSLLLRSRLLGDPGDPTLDANGVSVMWQDARLESPAYAEEEDEDALE